MEPIRQNSDKSSRDREALEAQFLRALMSADATYYRRNVRRLERLDPMPRRRGKPKPKAIAA